MQEGSGAADAVADEPPRNDGDKYRAARIGTAIALTAVIAFLLILDGLSPDYDVNQVTLTALLSTVLTLYGIEVTAFISRLRK